jgi:glycosyltransferase involved in cell wall biosynthesis
VRDVPAGVSVRGVLPSLADEYARARIVLDPVRGATGIQVKTVDALCHGRPVVATRAGGGLAEGTGVTVAETADDFRTALVRLLRDDALWRRRAAEAGDHARREFSPDAAFAPLVDRLAVA